MVLHLGFSQSKGNSFKFYSNLHFGLSMINEDYKYYAQLVLTIFLVKKPNFVSASKI